MGKFSNKIGRIPKYVSSKFQYILINTDCFYKNSIQYIEVRQKMNEKNKFFCIQQYEIFNNSKSAL